MAISIEKPKLLIPSGYRILAPNEIVLIDDCYLLEDKTSFDINHWFKQRKSTDRPVASWPTLIHIRKIESTYTSIITNEKPMDNITDILVQEVVRKITQETSIAWSEDQLKTIARDKAVEVYKELSKGDQLDKKTIDKLINEKVLDVERNLSQKINDISKQKETVIIERDVVSENEVKPDREINVGAQHQAFKTALDILLTRQPLYVYGPTGSGKTRSIQDIFEKVLKIPFVMQGVHIQSTASALMGHVIDKYVPGAAFKPYTEGGALIINEIDAGSPAINLVLNQLTDEWCNFPHGMFQRHKNFYLVATANTLGNGSTLSYVGRAPQDKAMLNRFVFLNWPYDKKFESTLARKFYVQAGGNDNREIEEAIEDFFIMRQATEELAIQHILSSRNLFQLATMKGAKIDKHIITRSVIARGLVRDQYEKITERANKIKATMDSNIKDVEVLSEGSSVLCPI